MDVRSYIPLNFGMMANGYNWVILFLMVAIAGMGLALIFPSIKPSGGSQ